VNICQNENSRACQNEMSSGDKYLNRLERVKGIEPSYSAWKAAALPLSYTRISVDQLSRQAGRLNRYAPVRARMPPVPQAGPCGP
jgi:hypothetical protein